MTRAVPLIRVQDGKTALDWAVETGHEDVAMLLQSAGGVSARGGPPGDGRGEGVEGGGEGSAGVEAEAKGVEGEESAVDLSCDGQD